MHINMYSNSELVKSGGAIDHVDIADSLNTCGDAYSSLGEYEIALPYYKKSLEMRRRLMSSSTNASTAAANDECENVCEAHLLNTIGVVLDRLGIYNEALEYKLEALEMRRRRCQEDNKDVAASLNSVGVAYDRLGDYPNAIDNYLKSLNMRYRLLKESKADKIVDKNIADILHNLGVAYENLKNYSVALDYHQKSLDMRRNIYVGTQNKHELDSIEIADSLKSIGVIHGKLNKHEKCLEYLFKSYEIKQRIHQGNHLDLADLLNSIGHSYGTLGDYDLALEYLLKSLDMRKNLFSGDNIFVAESLLNIGDLYAHQHDYTKAVFYYFKCIDMRTRLLKENEPEMANLYDKIGQAYMNSNDYDAALGFFNDSLRLRQSLNNNENMNQLEMIECLTNIGDVHMAQKKYAEALDDYSQTLSMFKQMSVTGEPIANSLNKIGDVYFCQQSYHSALKFYLDSYNTRKIICTTDNKVIVRLLFNIGLVFLALNDFKFASNYFEKSLDMLKRLFNGKDDVEIADCYEKIGDAYIKVYNYQKAFEAYKQSVDIRKRLNLLDESTRKCLDGAGISALLTNDAKKGLDYLKQSLELFKVAKDQDNVDLASTMNSIGMAYQRLDQTRVALEYKMKSYEMRKRLFGNQEDRAELAESMDSVGTAYDALGDMTKAIEFKTEALKIRNRIYSTTKQQQQLDVVHPEIADSLCSIGITYEHMGNLKLAFDYFYKSLTMKKQLFGDDHPSILELHTLLEQVNIKEHSTSDEKQPKSSRFDKMFKNTKNIFTRKNSTS